MNVKVDRSQCDFSNLTQVTDMIEACHTCLGYVFSEIQAMANTTPRFLADVDGFVS